MRNFNEVSYFTIYSQPHPYITKYRKKERKKKKNVENLRKNQETWLGFLFFQTAKHKLTATLKYSYVLAGNINCVLIGH